MEEIIHRCKDGTVWTKQDSGEFDILIHWPGETIRSGALWYTVGHDGSEVWFDEKCDPWFKFRNRLCNKHYEWVSLLNPLEFASETIYWGGDTSLFDDYMLQPQFRRYFRFNKETGRREEVANPWKIWAAPQPLSWQIVGDVAWAPIITAGMLIQPYLMSPSRGIYRTDNILGLTGYQGQLIDSSSGPLLIWAGKEYPVGEQAVAA